MSTTSVAPGEAGYTTLYDKWQLEGSPNGTFERLGEHGGELWLVRVDDDGNTVFHLRAAAGPTDPGYDKPVEWDWGKQKSGYLVEMRDTGLQIKPGKSGHINDWRVRMEDFPYDETVWDPS